MYKKIIFPLLALTIIFSFGIPQAFADELTIKTDKSSYTQDDIIYVTIGMGELSEGQFNLDFYNNDGNWVEPPYVYVGKLDQKISNDIGTQFKANKLKTEGTYTVKVQYGEPNQTAETTFRYEITDVSKPTIEKIPTWVKNIFSWYAQDQVTEKELLDAIKYLINEKILLLN